MILIGFLHRRYQEAKAEALAAFQRWRPDEWHLALVLSEAEYQPCYPRLKVGANNSNTWTWRWRCLSGFKSWEAGTFGSFSLGFEKGIWQVTYYCLQLFLFLVDSGGRRLFTKSGFIDILKLPVLAIVILILGTQKVSDKDPLN